MPCWVCLFVTAVLTVDVKDYLTLIFENGILQVNWRSLHCLFMCPSLVQSLQWENSCFALVWFIFKMNYFSFKSVDTRKSTDLFFLPAGEIRDLQFRSTLQLCLQPLLAVVYWSGSMPVITSSGPGNDSTFIAESWHQFWGIECWCLMSSEWHLEYGYFLSDVLEAVSVS